MITGTLSHNHPGNDNWLGCPLCHANDQAKLEALEKALRRAEWGYYRDDTYEGGKCPACGGLRRGKLTGAQYGHRDGCTTVAALARKEGPKVKP